MEQETKKRGRPKKIVEPVVNEETKENSKATTEVKQKELEIKNIVVEKKSEWPDIKVLKDWDRTDPLKLSAQDPEYAYRWLRDKADNLSIKTSNDPNIGYWKIVPPEHLNELEKRFGTKILRAADGLCHKGDLVLAYMPKEFHKERLRIKEERAKKAVQSVKETLEKGIPGKGILTEKQLGMEGKDYKR